jgi:hypothetical protein
MFESLTHYGLTQSILQILIIVGVILVVIGMFWHYILAGSLVLFAFVVFFYETPKIQTADTVAVIKQIKPDTPIETEKQRWYRQFMEDCITIAENPKETCDNIWNDRMMDESHLEVNPDAELSNASYKMKRNKL